MNLIECLETDHTNFRTILTRLEKEILFSHHKFQEGWCGQAGEQTRALLGELLPALMRHEEIERQLLYPALISREELAAERIALLEKEHGALDGFLNQFAKDLPRCSEKSAAWMITNLLKLVNSMPHHMQREEDELFAYARKRIPAKELERLGKAAESLQVRVVSL